MTDLQGRQFIFIGGSPRSGTTLVQNMLDSHPEVLGGPEFLHLPDIIGVRKKLHYSIDKEWIDEFCSRDQVDRLTSTFIQELLLPLANKYECKFFSEKTPSNVLIFDDLVELFPEARCIHVVRDPRAIISSMLQVGRRAKKKGRKTQDFTTSVPAAIDYVKKCFQAGFKAAERTPDRVLTIVYEQLVSHPEREARRMCDFVGLEWSEQILHPASQKHLGEKAITGRSGEVWYDSQKYNRNPDPGEIDKWKRQLTALQKAMITMAFRDFEELEQLEYDLSVNRLSAEHVLCSSLSVMRKIKRQFRRVGRAPRKILSGYREFRKAAT